VTGHVPIAFGVDIEARADGSTLLHPHGTLPSHPERFTDALRHWAGLAPDRVCFARRSRGGQWCSLTYAEILRRVRGVAAALARLGLSADRPIVILSGNGLEHQVLALAALYAGIPYIPVSPSYSLLDHSLRRIRHIAALMTPGLVAVFGQGDFENAIDDVAPVDAPLITDWERHVQRTSIDWATLCTTAPDDLVDARAGKIPPTAVAKFLLTSGSTGTPKAVPTTHRMMCTSQAMLHIALPFLREEPPVLVDWLPWNHVFGGSHNVGASLMNGGSFYIDDGRPTPSGMGETIRNLREIAPTVYFNVPKGFEALVPALAKDVRLCRNFFRRLRAHFYAGASLSQPVWDALDRMAERSRGATVAVITSLGATETGPSVTFTTPEMSRAGSIGLPVAGEIVKLVPTAGKLEIRVKGPNVMDGYWRQPELHDQAFDYEGFYRLGDAVRWVDARAPAKGLFFDGRLAEDFKLATGTWVSVGPLRLQLLNLLGSMALDAVIGAPDRDFVTAMVFLDVQAASALIGAQETLPIVALVQSAGLRRFLIERLREFNRTHGASSMRIERALILEEPPSLADGEITDKGSINQRVVRERRAALLASLYDDAADPHLLHPTNDTEY
jgi:feruloyl-CoA synthase